MLASPLPAHPPEDLAKQAEAATSISGLANAVVEWMQSQGLPLSSIYFEVAGRLRGVALRGYWQVLEGFSIEQGVIAETFRTGALQLVPDVRTDPRYIAAVPGVVAELSLPVIHNGDIVGVMNVESPNSLSQHDVEAARQAVGCFERRLAELGGPDPESPWQRLARRSGELAELDDPADIGNFAVRSACEIVGFRSAMLVIDRSGTFVVQAACGPLEDAMRELSAESLAAVASWTASATSAYTVGAMAGRGFAGHEALRGAGIEALASASLQSNGGRHGFLLTAGEQAVETDITRVQQLEILATHAASALYTAFALEALRERASQDALTGLGHSAAFHERLGEELALATGPIAVLLIDLDHFKQINDTLGHVIGDRVLVDSTRLLGQVMRESDELFRVGGDEFAAVVAVASIDEALRIADRITRTMRDKGRTRVSVGVAVIEPGSQHDSDTVLAYADLALYDAKRAGRDQAALYRPELRAEALDRAHLLGDLAVAIDREQLFLEYQPLVDLTGDRVIGLEALVRWQHPERGVISPAVFIPLAERGDHIEAIGQWVMERACEAFGRWRSQGWAHPDMQLALNVSAAELHPALVSRIESTLARFEIPADRLVIEVTESVFIDELGASEPLSALRDLGVNVAVDDFGTGYSSLSYLHRLPVNVLKIDRSFVAGLDDPTKLAVTRAIVDLGRSLGLSIVGEGVERVAQLERLLELGCDHGQGFLWSAPVRASEVPALCHRLEGAVLPRSSEPVAPG